MKRIFTNLVFASMLFAGGCRCYQPNTIKRPPLSERIRAYIDPIQAPSKLNVLSKYRDKSIIERLNLVYSYLRDGGKLGLRYYQPQPGSRPKTAIEVMESGSGDCNEMSFLMISGFDKIGLDKDKNVKIGGLLGRQKMGKSNEFHILPILLVRGEVPEQLRWKAFEANEKLKMEILKFFEIGNGESWHLITVDPQRHLGGHARINQPIIPLDVNGVRATYFLEMGNAKQKGGEHIGARRDFLIAEELIERLESVHK
jgi:hypothetical protein